MLKGETEWFPPSLNPTPRRRSAVSPRQDTTASTLPDWGHPSRDAPREVGHPGPFSFERFFHTVDR